jgi:toxin ParE1/3/4
VKKPSYRLTRAADAALDDIFRRGVREFGLRQAQDYILSLHQAFEMLARFPEAGRSFREFRRHEHASHVVFYQVEDGLVIVVDLVPAGRDLEAWARKQ